MLYEKIRPVLYAEDKELFDKIFENGTFCFSENPILIDQLDIYDDEDAAELRDKEIRFGCKIEKYNVYIPVGLPFFMKKRADRHTEVIFIRNGVELITEYLEDDTDFDVELTDFGKKLYKYSEETGNSLIDAYELVKHFEKSFGINVTG